MFLFKLMTLREKEKKKTKYSLKALSYKWTSGILGLKGKNQE